MEFEHRIDQETTKILLDIFRLIRSTGENVDSVIYRAQHEHQLNLLDELEKKGYLRKDSEKYFISLSGLYSLKELEIDELRDRFEKIFRTLREHYKIKPKVEFKVADLSLAIGITFKETAECLSYMVEASFWGSRSNNMFESEAQIKPSEQILRYKTFQDMVSEIMHWRSVHKKNLESAIIQSQSDAKDEASVLSPIGPIFSILFGLNSDEVQRIVELAGLVPNWSLTKEQGYSHTTRNRAYRERVTTEYSKLSVDSQQSFVLNVARELIKINKDSEERINVALNNIGWVLLGERLIRVDVLHPSDLVNLPEAAINDLTKAAERLPDDLSGAISAACGAIDSVCEEIYRKHSLGAIGKASFQEKVNTALSAIKALEKLKAELLKLGWEENDASIFCENLKKAISHAAYVMQSLRSKMGDVHGSKPQLAILAFDSLKWAMIISSLLREKL